MKRDRDDKDEEGWEYGDVWKESAPDEQASERVEFVEVLRADIGSGYDDSYMMELVTYLGARGVRATYDSFSLGAEVGAIKTYVLKAEAGKEDEAIQLLQEKFKEQR